MCDCNAKYKKNIMAFQTELKFYVKTVLRIQTISADNICRERKKQNYYMILWSRIQKALALFGGVFSTVENGVSALLFCE